MTIRSKSNVVKKYEHTNIKDSNYEYVVLGAYKAYKKDEHTG